MHNHHVVSQCLAVSMGCLMTLQTTHIRVPEEKRDLVFYDEKTARRVLDRDNLNQ